MNKQTKRSLKLAAAGVNVSIAQKEYVRRFLNKMRAIRMYQVLIFIVLLSLWEGLTRLKVIDSFIFSSPTKVVKTFTQMAMDGSIFYHIGVTLAETLISFGLVCIIGMLMAILLWWNDSVSKVLEPYLVVLNSLPKSALAPIFIVWLGNNIKTIIVAAVSVAVFGTIISLYTAFNSVEEDKIKLIHTLGGHKLDVLIKIVIPSNVPSILSIAKVNLGLSLVGVIIGEFLAAKAGLGYLIIYGSQVFRLDWVILSIVLLCIMATVFYKLISTIENHVHF